MTHEATGGSDPQRHKSTDATTKHTPADKVGADADLATLLAVYGPAACPRSKGHSPDLHFDPTCLQLAHANSTRPVAQPHEAPLRPTVCSQCDPRPTAPVDDPAPLCGACETAVSFGAPVRVDGVAYHEDCVSAHDDDPATICWLCKKPITTRAFSYHEEPVHWVCHPDTDVDGPLAGDSSGGGV